MFESLLIANRGEIACRIERTARRLGIRTIAVYAEVDRDLPHVDGADVAILLESPASYRDPGAILRAAQASGANAVHPGYGFLSESSDFARSCLEAGLTWVGPSPEAMDLLADKVEARNHVASHGVPVLPGCNLALTDPDEALAVADQLGYPLMVKAVAGGGGIGMSAAADATELAAAFRTATSRGRGVFGNAGVLLERYVPTSRHVEVQVLGDALGNIATFTERDCSVQRRHQKVIEESPSPAIDDALRHQLRTAAAAAAASVGYVNAGTVEFLLDVERGGFYFLEMNTRLQVEHPITEQIHGIDLVEAQLRIACGEPVPVMTEQSGHSMEMRIYAEDSIRFIPRPGRIGSWVAPTGDGVRLDAGYRAGNTVTQHFDPLLAKLIVTGSTRVEMLTRSREALSRLSIDSQTNIDFLGEVLRDERFVAGDYDTNLVQQVLDERGRAQAPVRT